LKIKLDENMPRRLSGLLGKLGHDIHMEGCLVVATERKLRLRRI
jgi:hypothetical protein